MKKILYTICATLIVAALLLSIYWKKEEPKVLNGTKITDNLYKYNLNNDENNLSGYSFTNDTIYFLLDQNDEYELYSRNIYEKESSKKGTIPTNSFCELINNYITCKGVDNASIYDLELNLKYQISQAEDEDINIIPYKDTFLKVNRNIISLFQDNKEIDYKTLDEKFTSYTFYKYFYTKENTFILFIDYETNYYYLYDIKENKTEEITMSNLHTYENGFYFINSEKYKIYDLKNNTINEYNNPLKNNDFLPSTSNNNYNMIYLYDKLDNTLKIINIEDNTLKEITMSNFYNIEVLDLIIKENYLYIITYSKKTDIYLYDLNNLPVESVNLSDYINKFNENNLTMINDINSNYHLSIHVGSETEQKYPDFTAKATYDYRFINEALTKINIILNKLNKEFLDTFYELDYKGLNVYLTGKLTPSDYNTQASNPSAYSLLFNNEYMIVLDVTNEQVEEIFCHELMHNIELNIENHQKEPFAKWLRYNPKDFNYLDSYTKPYLYDYTIYENDDNNVYFVDKYSHTYPAEDRARIFEKICAYEEKSFINEYPNLKNKADYLKEEILTNFPSLKNTTLFNSLNE